MLQVYLMCVYEQWGRNEFESEGTRPALNIFRRAPLKVQLVVLVSAFEIASTVWSVSCFLQSRRHSVYMYATTIGSNPRWSTGMRHLAMIFTV